MALTSENPQNQFILTGNQKKIFDRLSEIKGKYNLGQIFYGTLRANSMIQLEDKHSFVAHGFRELIEKLGRSFSNLNIQDIKERDENKFDRLKQDVHKINLTYCIECKKCLYDEGDTSFLNNLKNYLSPPEHEPKNRDMYKDVLRLIDPSKVAPPQSTLDLFSKQLSELYRYFALISHHRTNNLSEFDTQVAILEEMLLRLFYPPTSFKHEEIDKIIDEIENNDY